MLFQSLSALEVQLPWRTSGEHPVRPRARGSEDDVEVRLVLCGAVILKDGVFK